MEDGRFSELSFVGATMVYSNLGGLGPDVEDETGALNPPHMRLGNVGRTADGTPIDLLIKNETENVQKKNVSGPQNRMNVRKTNGGPVERIETEKLIDTRKKGVTRR